MTMTLTEAAGPERPRGFPIMAIIAALAIMLVIFCGLFVWRGARSAAPSNPTAVPVAVAAIVATPSIVPVSLEATGALRAVREVVLAPEVAGRVVDIRFTAGSTVSAGALLVQLNDAPERADRSSAQAHAAFTEAQMKRSQDLSPTGAEPRELLEQRRAERDQALAAVHQLDARLLQKQVRAPFAGEIGIRRINLGQYLNAGDTIATLTDLNSLYVEFSLPQQELSRIASGSIVQIHSDAFPQRTFTAHVNAIEPKVGENTRNISVQALLSNSDRALRPGMYVTASLAMPSESAALLVPATAIQTSAAGDVVTVVRGDDARRTGKAESVSVKTGRRVGDEVIVTSGIAAGDVVVTEGQLRVRPGMPVRVTRLVRAKDD
jgi:membrane fusion protein, multidrug efflux system